MKVEFTIFPVRYQVLIAIPFPYNAVVEVTEEELIETLKTIEDAAYDLMDSQIMNCSVGSTDVLCFTCYDTAD